MQSCQNQRCLLKCFQECYVIVHTLDIVSLVCPDSAEDLIYIDALIFLKAYAINLYHFPATLIVKNYFHFFPDSGKLFTWLLKIIMAWLDFPSGLSLSQYFRQYALLVRVSNHSVGSGPLYLFCCDITEVFFWWHCCETGSRMEIFIV